MKMKEFGPPGGVARPWRPPLDPPMVNVGDTSRKRRGQFVLTILLYKNVLIVNHCVIYNEYS